MYYQILTSVIIRIFMYYSHFDNLQGAITEMQIFLNSCHFSYINTTDMCNMANERKFTQLSSFFQGKHLRPLIKSINWFEWGLAENACAQPILNLWFWGFLRPEWPQMSHICSFSLKCHIWIAFVNMRLLRDHFATGQILLL